MALETNLKTPLASAVKAAGSQSAFGRLIGRRQSTINDWLKTGKDLPAEYVLTVERELGVSRHLLRPDLYPHDAAPSAPSLSGGVVSPAAPIVACDRSAILHPEARNA